MEEFAADLVADGLRERGVEIKAGSGATKATASDGRVELELESGDSVSGDRLLVAIGRRPNTDQLGLETIGLEPGKPIEVDEQLRANEWLFAVGDVNGRVLLTHMGKYQARVAADVILGKDARITEDGARSPQVIFTDPQVASVGHTLAAAQEAGIDARAVDLSTQNTAGGSFFGREAPAQTRFVVDQDRGVLAGATFVGPGHRRVPARGHDRGGGRGAARAPGARGALVPDAQRGLVEPDRGGGALEGPTGAPPVKDV